jgi:rod shape-determining protein MreB
LGLGLLVTPQAERVGSSDVDEAIMDRLRRHHGLIIGAPTAERLKIELASAVEPKEAARTLTIKGRDVQTGTPRAIDVTSE